jgi:uncharacterized membrane protein (DUF2068 family)
MVFLHRHRIAAVLAFIIGLLSIMEGGSVLLGLSTKPYHVLAWLVMYNVALGFVSVGAAIGLWSQRGWGSRLSAVILILHGSVFLVVFLLYEFGKGAAFQSVMAMLFRTVVWLAIYSLVLGKKRTQT